MTIDIEVTYRPKGCTSYVGSTKYDGWTAIVMDRKADGTLLDGHGNPLPDGQPPVFLSYELYKDVDFNEIDFGDFVGEFEVAGIRRLRYDDVFEQFAHTGRFSTFATFIAPRRHRPEIKIVLSNAPSGTGTDGRTKIIQVNRFTPHLQQVILNELMEVVSGFVESRYSLKCVSDGEKFLVELSDVFVDCTPNAEGKPSRFGCLSEFVPDNFLDDLANRLMSTYEIEVDVVEGAKFGLLLRPNPIAP